MIALRLASAVLVMATFLGAQNAAAFSEDTQTMNNSKNASNFSDPDERMPAGFEAFGQDNQNTSNDNNNAQSAAPFSPANQDHLNKRW